MPRIFDIILSVVLPCCQTSAIFPSAKMMIQEKWPKFGKFISTTRSMISKIGSIYFSTLYSLFDAVMFFKLIQKAEHNACPSRLIALERWHLSFRIQRCLSKTEILDTPQTRVTCFSPFPISLLRCARQKSCLHMQLFILQT
jgi:hypothetical protein